MKDKLKDYITENRQAFDSFEPPDVWPAISAGISSAPVINPKIFKAMIKYGFGASALVVATFVVVQKFAEKPQISSPRPVQATMQSRTVLDSSPSVISILPIKQPVLSEQVKNIEPYTEAPLVDTVQPKALIAFAAMPDLPENSAPEPITNIETKIPADTGIVNAATQIVDTNFKGVKRLEVTSLYCNVIVKGHNSDELKFTGEIKDGGGEVIVLGTMAYKNKDYLIRYKQEGDLLRVWIDEKDLGKRVRTKDNGKIDSYLNFEVPVQTAVSVENGSGNITVSGVNSKKTTLTTHYGKLKVDNISGDLDLASSSGNIVAKRINGNVKSKSSYGEQRFDSINGNIYLRSSSGNIEVSHLTGDGDVASSYGRQKFSSVQGNLTAVASSGDIYIRHLKGNVVTTTSYGTQDFEDIQGDLTGKGSSGSIKVDGVTGKLSLGTNYGNITGKNVKLLGSSEFKASSGNISVQLANETKELRFDLVSSSGKLSVKKDNQDITSDDRLTAGDGKIEIRGSTTYGNQQYR